MPRPDPPAVNLPQQMAQAFLLNDRMNQLVLEHLDKRAWREKFPSQKGRTIADIFAHVHNVRCKWLRLSAPHLKLPEKLNRRSCNQKQVQTALAESALRCSEMLTQGLNASPGPVPGFVRDGWARAWRPGAEMLAYMIAHEAHHRGQVCMLAHQLGFPLPMAAGAGMWGWERLARQCGFELPGPAKAKRPAKGRALR